MTSEKWQLLTTVKILQRIQRVSSKNTMVVILFKKTHSFENADSLNSRWRGTQQHVPPDWWLAGGTSWSARPANHVSHSLAVTPASISAESIRLFTDDQAFSPSYGLAPHPPYPPSPANKLDGDTQEDWERETVCWRERGRRVGEEPIHTEARKPGPLKSFDTLCNEHIYWNVLRHDTDIS